MLRSGRSFARAVVSRPYRMSSSGQEVRKATVLVDYESAGDGRIAIITLNRPKKKNAFTEASYNEVAAQLRSADKDESVKAIVITGNGDYYSSGNDLSNFSKLMHPVTMAKAGRNILYDFVDAFLIRTPLVAAVNGPAFGIAVTTLGLCDEVIAAKSTKLKTPFAELGQAPEGCSSYTFPAIMGNEAANRILWDSENMTAETALACGLVHKVVEDKDVVTTALAAAQKYAALTKMPELHEKLGKRLKVKNAGPSLVTDMRRVNAEESDVLEKAWISSQCLTALGNFMASKNNKFMAYLMYLLNYLGFLWGQPKVTVPRPGFRN